jgi:Ni,Fe-hydrogenase III component G
LVKEIEDLIEFCKKSRLSYLVKEDRITVDIAKKDIKNIINTLRVELKLHLSAIICIDLYKEFQILYEFEKNGFSIDLRINIHKSAPSLPSIARIIPVANYFEREIMDLFGVIFEDHPQPERYILPKDWPEGNYPMKK